MCSPTKDDVRHVLDEADVLDLADGAYWAYVHDRLGLEYGEVMAYIAQDPAFYGYADRQQDSSP